MPRVKGQTGKTDRSAAIPQRFVAVGGVFMVADRKYLVERRPKGISPCEACAGCGFLKSCCPPVACSSFDRADGVSVWFREVNPAI